MRNWFMAFIIVISLGSGLLGGTVNSSNPIKPFEHGAGT